MFRHLSLKWKELVNKPKVSRPIQIFGISRKRYSFWKECNNNKLVYNYFTFSFFSFSSLSFMSFLKRKQSIFFLVLFHVILSQAAVIPTSSSNQYIPLELFKRQNDHHLLTKRYVNDTSFKLYNERRTEYLIKISVGTPPQDFMVSFDTGRYTEIDVAKKKGPTFISFFLVKIHGFLHLNAQTEHAN